jgi:multisite-specific tRNA:(cytosine-C5)-methyltransferase
MLKVGGRVVYSTCSMNPVEDEAVLAAAIEKCGGLDLVDLVETKNYLPGLRRSPGLKNWSIMDKTGRIWDDYEAVEKQRNESGDDGLGKLSESMFSPKQDLHLDRAMRVFPHYHDTGAFFIAILEKKSEIRVRSDEKPIVPSEIAKDVNNQTNGHDDESVTVLDDEPIESKTEQIMSPKRKIEESLPQETPVKRARVDEEQTQSGESQSSLPLSKPIHQPTTSKSKHTPFEEAFKYISPDIPELEFIQKFYNLNPRFPSDRFMVRNAEGTATKNIYYTTSLAKDILQENEGKGMKFVHAGIKMFVKQDAPSPEVCPWRIQTDGLRVLEPWVGEARKVKLWKKGTLRKLLIEMFPKFSGEDGNLGEVGEQVKDLGMGCCVLIVEPRVEQDIENGDEKESVDLEGLTERMVFPLWKSIQSLNLMLPKEERKALLLRLFNDGSDLVNLQQHPGGRKPEPRVPMDKVLSTLERSVDEALEAGAVRMDGVADHGDGREREGEGEGDSGIEIETDERRGDGDIPEEGRERRNSSSVEP